MARSAFRLGRVVWLATLALSSSPRPAGAVPHPPFRQPLADAVAPMLSRLDRYLQAHEVDGVTMDWRYSVSPSEEIRQSVVCQLLAYAELHRSHPSPRIRADVVEHADFLIGRLGDIRSFTPFDGMLAYSLLQAYDATGDPRYLEVGGAVTGDLIAIPTSQCILNGGLMVAMATAAYARLTGSAAAAQKTTDILTQLVPYQNADGSFPHWCFGSRDIHYTGWMAMELIHLGRLAGDARIPDLLARMTAFLDARVDASGRARYAEGCTPDSSSCEEYFYSRATGCGFDHDTRGWTVEPAYAVLLFGHQRSPAYERTLGYLRTLERGGTFADLFGYWPPPSDPEYPWTIADTSVVNMSIIFWALATLLEVRLERGERIALVLDDAVVPQPPPAPPPAAVLRVGPNPARGRCAVRFELAVPAPVRLDVHDVSGRRIRRLVAAWFAPGVHTATWDGRDSAGRAVPRGVYLVRLMLPGGERRARISWAP